jgi:protein phosphatase
MGEASDSSDRVAWRRAMSPLLEDREFQPLSSRVRVEFAARSDTGKVRTSNEDHYLILRLGRTQETLATSLSEAESPHRFDEAGYAMLVADGLGGTGPGGVASRVAISALVHLALHYGHWNVRIDQKTAFDVIERLEWSYGQVADAVVRKSRTSPELAGMATTMTAAYSGGDDLFIAHVGHCRAYRFRQGEIRQLTRDQTLRRHLAAAQQPTPVARATADLRHILTDTIGGTLASPHVQLDHHKLLNGDCLLLCSDGLTAMVADDRIADLLSQRRALQETCDAIVDLALARGGVDNVTVLLAQYKIPPEPVIGSP